MRWFESLEMSVFLIVLGVMLIVLGPMIVNFIGGLF